MGEYEYMGSGSGAVVLANMTKNPSYATAKDPEFEATTSFTPGKEEDKQDHTYEFLPIAIEEDQGETADGGQEDTAHTVYAN